MNQELQFHFPNTFEINLLNNLLRVPRIKDEILERNGLKDVDYICKDCQTIVPLPIYNDDKYWNLHFEAADMYDDSYYCGCGSRRVQLKNGEQ